MEYKPGKCETCGASTRGCGSCKPDKVVSNNDEDDFLDDYGDGRGSTGYSHTQDKGQGITVRAKVEGPHTSERCGYSSDTKG